MPDALGPDAPRGGPRVWPLLALLALVAACGAGAPTPPRITVLRAPPGELLAPAAFDAIGDDAHRSQAIFSEASRVMLHPRCVNCHPAGDAPTQRDALERHEPPVFRGDHDRGVAGLECTSCHQDRNAELARVPGAPRWQLAPRAMTWAGKTRHELCEQIKDPARNGGRTLDAVVEHATHDAIVGWGWHPGADRAPAPGTQAEFGALMAAWARAGAACPPEETATREARP